MGTVSFYFCKFLSKKNVYVMPSAMSFKPRLYVYILCWFFLICRLTCVQINYAGQIGYEWLSITIVIVISIIINYVYSLPHLCIYINMYLTYVSQLKHPRNILQTNDGTQ
jgi:hypothetical protein